LADKYQREFIILSLKQRTRTKEDFVGSFTSDL